MLLFLELVFSDVFILLTGIMCVIKCLKVAMIIFGEKIATLFYIGTVSVMIFWNQTLIVLTFNEYPSDYTYINLLDVGAEICELIKISWYHCGLPLPFLDCGTDVVTGLCQLSEVQNFWLWDPWAQLLRASIPCWGGQRNSTCQRAGTKRRCCLSHQHSKQIVSALFQPHLFFMWNICKWSSFLSVNHTKP